MSHDEVTCRKLILECLIDFEDGSMPEADRAELQRHFEMCPPCLNFLTTYRATGRTLKMLKRITPSMLIALFALFVALTGTATATSYLLITGKQIKNGSIGFEDLPSDALHGYEVCVGDVDGERLPNR